MPLALPDSDRGLLPDRRGGEDRRRGRRGVIVDSITRGLSNGEIALQLGISRTRVKQHLTEVFQTLGAANRAEVAALAMRRNLLKI